MGIFLLLKRSIAFQGLTSSVLQVIALIACLASPRRTTVDGRTNGGMSVRSGRPQGRHSGPVFGKKNSVFGSVIWQCNRMYGQTVHYQKTNYTPKCAPKSKIISKRNCSVIDDVITMRHEAHRKTHTKQQPPTSKQIIAFTMTTLLHHDEATRK